MNTARRSLDAGGTTTDALAFGGTPGYLAITEAWNGTAWTEVADLNTGRGALAGGSQASSTVLNIAFGGDPNITSTEEWTAPKSISNLTITD